MWDVTEERSLGLLVTGDVALSVSICKGGCGIEWVGLFNFWFFFLALFWGLVVFVGLFVVADLNGGR